MTLALYGRLPITLTILLISLILLGLPWPSVENPEYGARIEGFQPPSRPTLRVPQDFPTIQAAIDAAPENATVLVAAGTYRENLIISKRNLVLSGEGAEKTIIEPAKSDLPIVLVLSAATVRGFTIRGARGWHASGIQVAGPDNFIIAYNVIEDNFPHGIYVQGRYWGSIYNNVIQNNGIDPNSHWRYGGVRLDKVGDFVLLLGDVDLRENTIVNNDVEIQRSYWVRCTKNLFRKANIRTLESTEIGIWQNSFEDSSVYISGEARRFTLNVLNEYRAMIVANVFRSGHIDLNATEFHVRGNHIYGSSKDGIRIWGNKYHDGFFLAQGRAPRRELISNTVIESARHGLHIEFDSLENILTVCRDNTIRGSKEADYAVGSKPSEALKKQCESN
ncbi:MAG: right-handed parallel beta-helix repeat-containing protein [Candidatus Caldarchaeum sp.]